MPQQPIQPPAPAGGAAHPAGRRPDTGPEPRPGAVGRRAKALPEPEVGRWRPISARGKVGLVLLAVATTALIMGHMLQPQLQLWAAKYARGELPGQLRPPCPPGSASAPAGCPGGAMQVQVLPALPAAPLSSR